MAGAALEIGTEVLWALPLSLHVVVAGRTTSMCLCMIKVDSRYPCDRGVATVALFRRQDVICRLRCCANAAADAVARLAIPRGAFEKGIRVTFLAGQIAMPASQLEAGREMVELRALLGCESCRRKSKCEQKCQKQGERAHRVG